MNTVSQHHDQKNQEMNIIGVSQAIEQIRQWVQKVSKSDVNILITGESGTGKEVVARACHQYSSRSAQPFVPVNCGAIPNELLESELFGHEKGAFTGAIAARVGRFELANGGTLFLDEIGDMPLGMQVKILRVLQEKVFTKVGSNKAIPSSVRIIAATNKNLEQGIEEGCFREDLYYRLNVFPIEMPPLRDRKEDIPHLIQDLVKGFERQFEATITLADNVYQALMHNPWLGNIRELSNLIERLFVLYPNETITLEQIPDKYQETSASTSRTEQFSQIILENRIDLSKEVDLKEVITQLETDYITEALRISDGVVSHAAKKLGLRRTTLVEKMRKYHISR